MAEEKKSPTGRVPRLRKPSAGVAGNGTGVGKGAGSGVSGAGSAGTGTGAGNSAENSDAQKKRDSKVISSLRQKLVYPIGHKVAGYTITAQLSLGKGMANVYVAEKVDLSVTTTWVIKQIIDPDIFIGKVSPRALNWARREREALNTEASVMQYLKNMPRVPRIVSMVEDKSYHSQLIVMDHIPGKTMDRYLFDEDGRPTPVPLDMAVSWIKDVASTLARLHNQEKPVVYRDCKPSNIIISDSGEVYLIDFGTAELISEPNTKPKRGMGTEGYAAPEQKSKHNPLDTRSDIYALGVTLYHLVTGFAPMTPMVVNGESQPIQSDSAPFTVSKLGLDSKIPVGINDIIIKCTQPNPDDRYQTIESLLVDLNNYKKREIGYRKKQRRKVNIVYSTALAGVVCLMGSGVFTMLSIYEADNAYNNAVVVAQQSGKVQDFYTAIDMKPTETSPYLGLIESIKQDGEFSIDEETQLLGLINPNLTELKEQEGYPELSYEVGRLYWFYYSSGDGMAQSSKWFKDAKDMGYNPDGLSDVYFNISNFSKNIAAAIKDSTDSGMYKDYWNNLNSALTNEHGTLVKLHMYDSMAKAVDSYAYKLNADGVPQEDIEKVLNDMSTFINSNTPKDDNERAYYDSIKSTLPGLQGKLDDAYAKSEFGGNQ